MWHEIGVALCLVLVIEGIVPFLYPARWKKMIVIAAQVDDSSMRLIGFASMMLGTGILYIIN
ncbi:MAG: DUF2065 domain-containing protein [Pseudomonadales bacterium]|nr:DUF2065 domain-containing protein [Pseudomonadales bacterium]